MKVAIFLSCFLLTLVGDTFGKTILPCGKNEVYNSCGTACPSTCEKPGPQPCTKQCVSGCFCVDGTLRNALGQCVPRDECCGKNQVFNECGSLCPPRCPTPFVIEPGLCAEKCAEGCFCSNKTVLNSNGECIPLSECPPIKG